MSNIPKPINESIRNYESGSPEKASLKEKLAELSQKEIEIPLIIGGKEVRTGDTANCIMPHNHGHVLATFHQAGEKEVYQAIDSAQAAWKQWSTTPLNDRAAIFLKMAELLTGPYRDIINAATMLNMSKNVFQAEIDAACELIDFWNFNCWFAQELYSHQPMYSPEPTKNSMEHRPLEGFVFAVTPFNFTSIAANLPSAPSLMGNVAIWKPSDSQMFSAEILMQVFKEAGVPDGVINMVNGDPGMITDVILKSPDFAGIHYTGSTEVFKDIWAKIGNNIHTYKTYPRIVGETGGKDFIIAHPSANPKEVSTAISRGAFEYQGQKCSAASRIYLPKSLWPQIKEELIEDISSFKMGSPEDMSNFINAVIHERSFDKLAKYIDQAKKDKKAEIIIGGNYDKSVGYFVEPTVIVTTDPHYTTMETELFGPVVTIYVYEDEKWEETLVEVDNTSAYALTGAVFSKDRYAAAQATDMLQNSAGNFYINDKCTGAVVGRQPFGGARASGTNDKAGSKLNLQRWVSQRLIKETFVPATDYRYPFMD